MDKLLISCNEICQEITAEIKGDIPEWLNIEMIRLGPGKWDLDDEFTLNHWLDGCAMLCKFSIKNGYVKYMSKFLQSDAYKKMIKVKRPIYTEFGTRSFPDPCKNVFNRIISQIIPSDLTDNGCINIYKLNNEYYASSETCNIWQICQKTLNVKKKINLDKVIGVNLACSHVQYIKNENYAYNFTSSFTTGMKYHLIKIPLYHQHNDNESDNQNNNNDKCLLEYSKILTTINSRWKTCLAYYHSFGITKNYIIFIELPLLVNGFKMATCTPKGKPLNDCFEWKQNELVQFYIISKNNGKIVQKYYSNAFFYFHIINSYEDNNYIIIDFMAYNNAKILDKWDIRKMRQNIYDNNHQAIPTRFVMPIIINNKNDLKMNENLIKLNNTNAKAILNENNLIMLYGEQLCKPGFELPTINYNRFNGIKYKYCYGSGIFELGNFSHSICKLNVDDKTIKIWKENDNYYPGECLFIPKPNSINEDDGILLCIVLSINKLLSHFLLILDAKSFKEIARAEIINGHGIIPPTIHGVFNFINNNNN